MPVSAVGDADSEISVRLDLSDATLDKWRARFIAQYIAGLHRALRARSPLTIDDIRRVNLINRMRQPKLENVGMF